MNAIRTWNLSATAKRVCPASSKNSVTCDVRTLIRGLNFFLTGTDPIGARLKSTSPIIFDPELRKEAEEFYTPLSARFLYNVLMMYLLEEEGLMDHFVFEGCNPTILKLSTLFRTESNDKIARLREATSGASRCRPAAPRLPY